MTRFGNIGHLNFFHSECPVIGHFFFLYYNNFVICITFFKYVGGSQYNLRTIGYFNGLVINFLFQLKYFGVIYFYPMKTCDIIDRYKHTLGNWPNGNLSFYPKTSNKFLKIANELFYIIMTNKKDCWLF